jgi:predicted nucleotide-binding protein (sugar kinase/HSP70/actin superfamily)
MCPKFRGAPDIVRLATGGSVSVIDETIDLRRGGISLLQSFLKIGERLGASRHESKKAFREAEQSFSKFQKGWMDRINQLPTRQLFETDIPIPPTQYSPPLAEGDEREGGPYRFYSPPPSPIKGGGKEIRTPLRIAFIGHPYNLFDIDINKDLALTKFWNGDHHL